MDYLPALRDAMALRDDGQLDAAIGRFKTLALEHSDRIEALLEAGKLAQKRGDWQDALIWTGTRWAYPGTTSGPTT